MKDIRFKNFAATGRDAQWEYAPLDKFFLWTPMFRMPLQKVGVIPPLVVINEIMKSGGYDAGMSGGSEWKPFEISQEEYEELVECLATNPEFNIKEDKELWDKPNFKKWHGALLSKYGKQIRNKS